MIGPLHHVEVVLHHEHRVARVHQPLQDGEQLPHVGHVQARRRLVEDVERLAGRPLGQLPRELHPLGLAAGERGRRLAEMEVVEADVAEGLELAGDVGGVGEELPCLADFHVQQFCDVLPLPADLERVFGEPCPAALLAGHPDIRQEVHVEPGRAVALAGLAPAARHVEAEAARLPAALFRIGQHREQLADVVPHLHVGCGVAPRRAADRRLIDHDHLVEQLGPVDRGECADGTAGAGAAGVATVICVGVAPAGQPPPQLGLEHVAHQ